MNSQQAVDHYISGNNTGTSRYTEATDIVPYASSSSRSEPQSAFYTGSASPVPTVESMSSQEAVDCFLDERSNSDSD